MFPFPCSNGRFRPWLPYISTVYLGKSTFHSTAIQKLLEYYMYIYMYVRLLQNLADFQVPFNNFAAGLSHSQQSWCPLVAPLVAAQLMSVQISSCTTASWSPMPVFEYFGMEWSYIYATIQNTVNGHVCKSHSLRRISISNMYWDRFPIIVIVSAIESTHPRQACLFV